MPLKRRGDDQDQEMKLTLTQSTPLIPIRGFADVIDSSSTDRFRGGSSKRCRERFRGHCDGE